jgi:hypothetical protein
MYFGVNTTSGDGFIQTMRNNTATAYNLILNSAGGYVGIGTTAPYSQLHLTGDVTFGSGSNARPGFKITNWGYSTSYRALLIGSSSTTYTTANTGAVTIAFNYDPSINGNSAFSGDGREIIFRRGTRFVTPNSADNAFNLTNLVLYDGNVGIGTDTPSNSAGFSRQLQISGTTAALTLTSSTGGSNYSLGAGSVGDFGLWNNTTSSYRWYVDSSGNVGVGTTTPRGNIDISSGSSTGTLTRSLHLGYSAADFYGFRVANINDAASFYAGTLRIQRGNGSAWNDDFNITNDGNIAIGVAAPQGTIPSLTRGVYLESSTNNAVIGYSLYVLDSANNRRGSMFLDDSAGVWGWDVTASSGVPFYVWRIAASEQMRLNTTGLGITEGNNPTQALSLYRSGSTNAIMSAGNSNTGLDGTWFGVDTAGNGIVNVRGALPLIFSTSALERARITSAGTLCVNATAGIGTSALTVQQTAGSTSAYFGTSAQGLYISNDATTPRLVRLSSSGNFGGGFIFTNGNTDVGTFTLNNEFIVGGTTDQGAYNLQCNGTGVWGAGAYVNGSDARLKDNIQPLDSGLDVVNAMRPVTFQYKQNYSKDQSVQPGFIAQELQEAMAGKAYLDGVVQEGTNHLNVAYQNIIPILVKAIQEQQVMINELMAKVTALESK